MKLYAYLKSLVFNASEQELAFVRQIIIAMRSKLAKDEYVNLLARLYRKELFFDNLNE
jgi:hypothetical protein